MTPRTLAALAALAALGAGSASAQDALPEAPGKATVAQTCTGCHDLGPILSQRRTPAQWAYIVEEMVGFGATLTDASKQEILGYLQANLGKDEAQPAAQPASPAAPAATRGGR